MCEAFEKLISMPEYGGGYNSLTPGHPNHVSASLPPISRCRSTRSSTACW